MSKKLDCVYFLVQKGKNIFYSPPATNPMLCWANAAQWDMHEGGANMADVDRTHVEGFRKSMKSAGWKAVKLELHTQGSPIHEAPKNVYHDKS